MKTKIKTLDQKDREYVYNITRQYPGYQMRLTDTLRYCKCHFYASDPICKHKNLLQNFPKNRSRISRSQIVLGQMFLQSYR